MLSKKVKNQHVFKWTYELYHNNYIVALLFNSYLTDLYRNAKFEIDGTILTCVNQQKRSNIHKCKNGRAEYYYRKVLLLKMCDRI